MSSVDMETLSHSYPGGKTDSEPAFCYTLGEEAIPSYQYASPDEVSAFAIEGGSNHDSFTARPEETHRGLFVFSLYFWARITRTIQVCSNGKDNEEQREPSDIYSRHVI
jgi:hypothetical protein